MFGIFNIEQNQGAIVKAKRLFGVCALAIGLAACSGGGGGDDGGASKLGSDSDAQTIGTGMLMSRTFVFTERESKGSTISDTEFEVRQPQQRVYAVGDVLIVDDHGGRLIKITGVQVNADTIVYSYEQASLAEAFETLDIRMQGDLTREELGESFDTGNPEIELRWADGVSKKGLNSKGVEVDSNVMELNFNRLGVQSKSGVEINGGATFRLNPDFGIKLERQPGGYLPHLSVSAMLSPNFKGHVDLKSRYGGAQVSYSAEWAKSLPSIRRLIKIPGKGIYVPFWVTPRLAGTIGISGSANSKLVTNYSFDVGGRFGVSKPAQADWDLIADVTSSADLDVGDAQGELQIGFHIPNVDFQFLIYSVAGPNFEAKLGGHLKGAGATRNDPYEEGIEVEGKVSAEMRAGLKGIIDLKDAGALGKLFGDVSYSYAPISMKIQESLEVVDYKKFFSYKGKAAVTVFDSGNVPDDVFEVRLDGRLVGRTSKGGSGQFRLTSLRPGEHELTITTVEDDAPPGTWSIQLNEGVTFSNGATFDSGEAYLGGRESFIIIAPEESEEAP